MKGLIDSNLIIYSSSKGTPDYAGAKAFLESVLKGPEIYALTWINVAEFVAVITQTIGNNPSVLNLAEALMNVDTLIHSPYIKLISEGENHWNRLKKILTEISGVKGPFVQDCRIAAIMLENGVKTIYTHDSDFRKIPELEVIDPLIKR